MQIEDLKQTPNGVKHTAPGHRPGAMQTIKMHPEWVQHILPT